MYSRYSNQREKPIRVPEHYSGCAFSDIRPTDSSLKVHSIDKQEPTAPPPPPVCKIPIPAEPSPPSEVMTAEKGQETYAVANTNHTAKQAKALPAIHNPFASLGKGLSLADGLDFDQLLILGLILLLSHSGQDTEIIWWLGLLLLCG